MSPKLILMDDFSFAYEINHTHPIINNMNLSLANKEISLLVGPSGSGKSTLALSLNGLYPDVVEGWKEGTIYFKGQALEDFKKGEVNKEIGVVFQDPESQFCMITVENELAFTMENIQIEREIMLEKMKEVLHLVGMEGYLDHSIHELSGGQKQKIALASVLLLEPSLLILDEPTANLDPASRKSFIDLIKRITADRAMSVFIIEHQLDDWLPLVDRVLAINKDGKLIADGDVRSVFYENYMLLQEEGIHLPRVITEAFSYEHEINKNNMPLLEKELACFLLDRNESMLEENTTKTKKIEEKKVVLDIQHIHFSRGKRKILNDITLQFYQGEFLGIVGGNGAGKSTLLQMLSGLIKPSSGKRTFLDQDYKKWDELTLRRQLGFVFQNPEHQFITDTVFDELAFGMRLYGRSDLAIQKKVEQLLVTFDLEDKRWSNPFSLSGGQKRRLSVATMLGEAPKLLLFDEPTFGQDAHTTKKLMELINALRDQGTTIVFVSHDMDLVDRYCERLIVVEQGNICFQGTPDELWKQEKMVDRAQLRLPFRVRIDKEQQIRRRQRNVAIY